MRALPCNSAKYLPVRSGRPQPMNRCPVRARHKRRGDRARRADQPATWSCRLCLLFGFILVAAARIGAMPRAGDPHQTATTQRADAPQTQETYRLRVENVEFGRVEVSTDGGQHYVLLG